MSNFRLVTTQKVDRAGTTCTITKELQNGKSRFTLRFSNGVVFHSNKRRYSYADLRAIARGTYEITGGLTESYSVTPEQAAARRKMKPEEVYAQNLAEWLARNKRK